MLLDKNIEMPLAAVVYDLDGEKEVNTPNIGNIIHGQGEQHCSKQNEVIWKLFGM